MMPAQQCMVCMMDTARQFLITPSTMQLACSTMEMSGDDMQARTQGIRTSSCMKCAIPQMMPPNMWNIQYNVIRRANRLVEAVDNKTITDAENFQAELARYHNQVQSNTRLSTF